MNINDQRSRDYRHISSYTDNAVEPFESDKGEAIVMISSITCNVIIIIVRATTTLATATPSNTALPVACFLFITQDSDNHFAYICCSPINM